MVAITSSRSIIFALSVFTSYPFGFKVEFREPSLVARGASEAGKLALTSFSENVANDERVRQWR